MRLPTSPASGLLLKRTFTGFTLVELVVVLLLVGILAAVGMPRFFTASPFLVRGFTDELSAAIRYANKIAVATGCDTRFVTTTNSYDLKQRANCSSGSFNKEVRIAGGGSGYSGAPPSSVTLSVASFYFDPNGRPRNSSSDVLLTSAVTVSVGSATVTVEAETGYVH